MSKYFVIHYIECSVTYWMTSRGYCYRQCDGDEKPHRISEVEYMRAYEMYISD